MTARPVGAQGFTDPACVQEIYVEDVGDIEIINGTIKVTLVVSRKMSDGEREVVAACRLVGPVCNTPKILSQIVSAMLGRPLLTTDIPPGIVPS